MKLDLPLHFPGMADHASQCPETVSSTADKRSDVGHLRAVGVPNHKQSKAVGGGPRHLDYRKFPF